MTPTSPPPAADDAPVLPVAIAFVPSAPALVPELTGGPDPALDPVRRAVVEVARRLAAVAPRWVVLGPGSGDYSRGVRGTFLGFGVDVRADLSGAAWLPPGGAVDPAVDLYALVGGWIAAGAGARARAIGDAAGIETVRAACAPAPMGLLVVGDGATTLTPRAPGGHVPESLAVQEEIIAALAAADGAALDALDDTTCAALGVDALASWRIAAGLAPPGRREICYADAPLGVGYVVAWWGP